MPAEGIVQPCASGLRTSAGDKQDDEFISATHPDSMASLTTSPPSPAPAECARGASNQGASSTYLQILKSSALIGGSTALNLSIGLIRTKAMAMILGPAGFGLMGAFTSIVDLSRSVVAMGISNSGVRQIAESVGSEDVDRIALTVYVLRRVAVVLGVLGALMLVMFSGQVSAFTFGSDAHRGAIAVLSFAVLFRLVSEGQSALLQGMRKIGDMARIAISGAVVGTVVSVPLVYWLREDGIALSLVAVAAMTALMSWRYSRRIQVVRPMLTSTQLKREAGDLFKLGFAFMASGLLMMSSAYAVRVILIRVEGLDAAGLFQSAWALGGLYVGFVLQAMGADFYPRLVGAIKNDAEANRLVNEQAQVSLLLAGIGVLATLAFAPLAVAILYSTEFSASVEVLRWICIGMMLRVFTWPMGYIIVARNAQRIFFATELAWAIFNVTASWLCIKWFGLKGAGIAFFASYVFHGLLIYPIVRSLTGFRWSRDNLKLVAVVFATVALTFTSNYLLPGGWSLAFATLTTGVFGLYAVRCLAVLVPPEQLPPRFQRILGLFRMARLGK